MDAALPTPGRARLTGELGCQRSSAAREAQLTPRFPGLTLPRTPPSFPAPPNLHSAARQQDGIPKGLVPLAAGGRNPAHSSPQKDFIVCSLSARALHKSWEKKGYFKIKPGTRAPVHGRQTSPLLPFAHPVFDVLGTLGKSKDFPSLVGFASLREANRR